jgi:hypothetical protein
VADRARLQIDHHRSRRQGAGQRKSGILAPPVDREPLARMIRRGRQTDEELCFAGHCDEQLYHPLANNGVFAQRRREPTQESLRTDWPMVLSAGCQHVDELTDGLSDLVRSLFVEQPHRTNSTPRNDPLPQLVHRPQTSVAPSLGKRVTLESRSL